MRDAIGVRPEERVSYLDDLLLAFGGPGREMGGRVGRQPGDRVRAPDERGRLAQRRLEPFRCPHQTCPASRSGLMLVTCFGSIRPASSSPRSTAVARTLMASRTETSGRMTLLPSSRCRTA